MLRTLTREVTYDKLGILPGERDHALELLTKLAYSFSPQEYDNHYEDLKESGLKSVILYYDANWHPICYEWVESKTLYITGLETPSYMEFMLVSIL